MRIKLLMVCKVTEFLYVVGRIHPRKWKKMIMAEIVAIGKMYVGPVEIILEGAVSGRTLEDLYFLQLGNSHLFMIKTLKELL